MAEKMKPPRHLKPATRRWWKSVVADFELEPHHVRLLTLAGESWDRCVQAREALAEHGLTFMDRHGSPRARPEVGIERDSRIAFARLLRELGLDVQPPSENRAPAILANAFRKIGGS
jgi:P27 family predicted phage terminase small subunit